MAQSLRVPGRGSAGADVFFLAEAPGRLGAGRTGLPLWGDRSGELFWQMVTEVGLVPGSWFVTNVLKCNPRDDRGHNRPPSPAEVTACAPHWRRELQAIMPRLVVPLGDLACRAYLQRPLAAARGRVVDSPWGIPAHPLYHPAYVCRHCYPLSAYRDDWHAMRRALALLDAREA